jgi:hypothetical protein
MVIFFMINEVQAAINRSNLSSQAKVRLADCLAPLAIVANQRLQEDDTAYLTMIAATPDEAAKFGIARWPELPERASLLRRRAAAVALHRRIERAAGEDILLARLSCLGPRELQTSLHPANWSSRTATVRWSSCCPR